MGAFTSTKAGDCNDPTTWGNAVGGAIPGAGDTAALAHLITIPDAFEWSVGTSPATGGAAAIAINSGGGITVGKTEGAANPGALRVLGPVTQANATTVTFRSGTKLTFDANGAASPGSTVYSWTLPFQSRAIFNGTAAARCKISSAGGAGNGYFTGSAAQSGQLQASYTDILRIGDATNPLVTTTPGAAGLLLLNCTADSGGGVRISDNGGSAVFRIENTEFSNTVGAYSLQISMSSAKTTGTRNVVFSVFDKIVNLFTGLDVTLEDNAYLAGWSATGSNSWASFKRFFVTWTQNNGAPNLPLIGNVSDGFFYPTGGTNPHYCTPGSAFSAITIDGCIFEYGGTDANGDIVNLPSTATATQTVTVTRCIKLPNAAGLSSGTLVSALGNGFTRFAAYHNTMHAGGNTDSSGCRVGETFNSYTGQVVGFLGNVTWDLQTGRGYGLCDISGSPGTDAVTAANCDYNGRWHTADGNCVVGGSTVAVNGYFGLVFTGATPPGVHDVVGDPQFVNPAACLRTWGAARAGTDGTAAQAIQALKADRTRIADLLAWIRAAFAVQNPAYANVAGPDLAYPGDPLTTDAAGNPLKGTLGAVAYKPRSSKSTTLLLLLRRVA